MADSAVAITAGTGTNLDTRTEATNGDHRQVVVIGDPSVTAGVAGVTASGDLQVYEKDIVVSGTITTQNLVPAGTATAGSAVLSGALNGQGTLTFQVTGTYTGALTLQGTVDGAAWVTIGGTPLVNVNTGTYLATVTSALQSIFQTDISGFNQVRVTGLAAMTGTATVTMRVTDAAALVGLDTSLPAGTAIIGALSANQSANIAQINGVTPLMGSGVNGTGAPRVSIATDQAALSVAGVLSAKVDQTTIGVTNGVALVAASGNAVNCLTSSTGALTTANVKASTGNVFGLSIANLTASTIYLQFYNTATAPTLGTGVVWFIAVPASATVNMAPGGLAMANFSTGIGIGASTTATGAGTPATAPAVTIFYK